MEVNDCMTAAMAVVIISPGHFIKIDNCAYNYHSQELAKGKGEEVRGLKWKEGWDTFLDMF